MTPPPPAYGSLLPPALREAPSRRSESEGSDHSYPPTPGPYAPNNMRYSQAQESSLSVVDEVDSSSSSLSPEESLRAGPPPSQSTQPLNDPGSSTLSVNSAQPLMNDSVGTSPRGGRTFAAKEPGNSVSQPRSEITRFLVKMIPSHGAAGGSHAHASKRLSFLPPGLLGTTTVGYPLLRSSSQARCEILLTCATWLILERRSRFKTHQHLSHLFLSITIRHLFSERGRVLGPLSWTMVSRGR